MSQAPNYYNTQKIGVRNWVSHPNGKNTYETYQNYDYSLSPGAPPGEPNFFDDFESSLLEMDDYLDYYDRHTSTPRFTTISSVTLGSTTTLRTTLRYFLKLFNKNIS